MKIAFSEFVTTRELPIIQQELTVGGMSAHTKRGRKNIYGPLTCLSDLYSLGNIKGGLLTKFHGYILSSRATVAQDRIR